MRDEDDDERPLPIPRGWIILAAAVLAWVILGWSAYGVWAVFDILFR